jgi:hypothetical protein
VNVTGWFFFLSATFKKMLVQKRKEQLKAYEKQEKMLREMKQSGKSNFSAADPNLFYRQLFDPNFC